MEGAGYQGTVLTRALRPWDPGLPARPVRPTPFGTVAHMSDEKRYAITIKLDGEAVYPRAADVVGEKAARDRAWEILEKGLDTTRDGATTFIPARRIKEVMIRPA